jgi:copper chaperone CopZ
MIKYTLKIDGMMCSMCEAHINDCVRNNFRVKKVSASHSKGEAVILTENEIDEAELKEAINKTGYELKSIQKSEETKKGLFGFIKK